MIPSDKYILDHIRTEEHLNRDVVVWVYEDDYCCCYEEWPIKEYCTETAKVVRDRIANKVKSMYKEKECERMKQTMISNIARSGNSLMHRFMGVVANCDGEVRYETVGPCDYPYLKISLEGSPSDIAIQLGKAFGSCCTIPEIVDVVNYNDRAVVVKFVDGSFTRSEVQNPDDIFDLDTGIAICLFKKALGEDGHKEFNDLIRHAHKVMKANKKKAEKEAKAKEEAILKRQCQEFKRKLKQKAKDDHDIFIQKQAYIQAMKETGMVLESSTEVTLEVNDGKKKPAKKVKK